MDPAAVDFRAFYPYTPNEVKHRKRTTSAQLKILESIFKRDTKPNAALRNELAAQLDMTARGVQVWFQNRRAKEKTKASKAAAVHEGSNANANSTSEQQQQQQSSSAQDPAESVIIPPTSTFLRDLPDLEHSSSQTSSPIGNSPPHLHVSCDSASTSWQSSPLATPDDFKHPADFSDMYMIRRGSLPVDVFPAPDDCSHGPPLVGHLDPFARRRSVDASLHRLAANPFANLARVKNGVLGGSGHSNEHSRVPSVPQPTFIPQVPNGVLSHARHSSADSRAFRFPSSGVPVSVSPSPSPLSPYHHQHIVRSSLPDNRLCTFSHRPVSEPIPGPLPSPDFSFGIASHNSVPITSPLSERGSPDPYFMYRNDEVDTEDDATSNSCFSRFGSIASIGTSESSVTSAYFSEVGSCHSDGSHSRKGSGHYVAGLMSGLNVGGMGSHEGSPVADVPTVMSAGLKEGDGTASYPSPSSTVSPGSTGSPGASSVAMSHSSELSFALQGKDQSGFPEPSGADSSVPFYLSSDNTSVPNGSLEFGSEFHFTTHDVPTTADAVYNASHYNGDDRDFSAGEHMNPSHTLEYPQDYHLGYSEGIETTSVSTSSFL
ncbi:hypothetical protein K435DRAFT_963128 [Dendrothele bispora CBS 962.96]|uniref:Homeobox domain-containing protein n=1 Tax=Dendrothele bispora (strain CBS 962.96) TaxID=1314807 RepID=A0A4S8MIR8_DENBC|nr:hypothetical protein K435DRAFT_963128 [Dendrothele bispora CBS 962.96]